MKDAKSQQNVPGRRFPLKIVIASLLVLLVAIAGCYYVLTNCGMQVYTYSTVPSSDVTIGVSINNNITGRGALTILDSGERMITFKVSSQSSENSGFFMQGDSERLRADLRIFWVPHDFGAFVYLPAGPGYNVTITCSDFKKIENDMVNKYTGGNLPLWVNDTVHGLYRYDGST